MRILLLGGTSEAPEIAAALAAGGHAVLVSQGTDTPMAFAPHPRVEVRAGALDAAGLRALLRERGLDAVVDATHPYAERITATARAVCAEAGVPYHRFERPALPVDDPAVTVAADHVAASATACRLGRVVLLTTGSRNLAPYVAAARAAGGELWVRVLPGAASRQDCLAAGVAEDHILAGRGPFTAAENERAIRAHGIEVVVTKESGAAGGVPAKLEAARRCGCRVVLVARPPGVAGDVCHTTIAALCAAVAPQSRNTQSSSQI